MPIKMKNICESILQDAHDILKTEGYESLNIRRVAKDSAIAAGAVKRNLGLLPMHSFY